jgi:hypothetical protein
MGTSLMVSATSVESMVSMVSAVAATVVMENSLWSLKSWRTAQLFQAWQLAWGWPVAIPARENVFGQEGRGDAVNGHGGFRG